MHEVSNLDENGHPTDKLRERGNYFWHSDESYHAVSSLMTMLHAVELPPTEGETQFAHTAKAYEALDPATQARAAARFDGALHAASVCLYAYVAAGWPGAVGPLPTAPGAAASGNEPAPPGAAPYRRKGRGSCRAMRTAIPGVVARGWFVPRERSAASAV